MKSFSTLAFIFMFVLYIILSSPVYAYRLILTKLVAPHFHSRIGKIVTTSGLIAGAAEFSCRQSQINDIDKSKIKSAIVLRMVCDGYIPVEEIKHSIQTKWVDKRLPNTLDVEVPGPLCYPEFQQYVESWMGFLFWKWESDFKISDHIFTHLIEENERNETCGKFVDHLRGVLLNKPFQPQKSPWEIHVVHHNKNVQLLEGKLEVENPSKITVLIFRCHHCFADGYSIMSLILEDLFGTNLDVTKVAKPSLQRTRSFRQNGNILKILKDLFHMAGFMGDRLLCKKNRSGPFFVSSQAKETSLLICATSKPLPMKCFKEVGKVLGVTFTGVLLSIICGGIAKNLKTSKVELKESEKDSVSCAYVLPRPGRPKKLRNHFTGGKLELPTNPDLKSQERIRKVSEIMSNMHCSVIPQIVPFYSMITGSQVTSFVKSSVKNRFVPCLITNFPGPGVSIFYNNIQLLSADFAVGLLDGVAGLGFMIFSYNGQIRISAVAENSVMSEEELHKLIYDVCEELNALKEICKSKTLAS